MSRFRGVARPPEVAWQGGGAVAKIPVKHSVALAVRKGRAGTDVLLVRRPEGDDEFPGIWGLPAASCRDGESVMQAARRIGTQKLGTPVEIGKTLGTGSQERDAYLIEMTLVEAFPAGPFSGQSSLGGADGEADGVTMYTAFRWGRAADLTVSAKGGSLCSQLLLTADGLTW